MPTGQKIIWTPELIEQIKKERQFYTAGQLAKRLGMSRTTIQKKTAELGIKLNQDAKRDVARQQIQKINAKRERERAQNIRHLKGYSIYAITYLGYARQINRRNAIIEGGSKLDRILTDVAQVFGIATDQLIGTGRAYSLDKSMYRFIYCVVAKQLTNEPYKKIADKLGVAHTIVPYADKIITDGLKNNDAIIGKTWYEYVGKSDLFKNPKAHGLNWARQ